jgi:hypothetical protein
LTERHFDKTQGPGGAARALQSQARRSEAQRGAGRALGLLLDPGPWKNSQGPGKKPRALEREARRSEAQRGAARRSEAQVGPWVIAGPGYGQGPIKRPRALKREARRSEAQVGPWKLKLKEIDGTALLQDPGPWRRREAQGGAGRALETET